MKGKTFGLFLTKGLDLKTWEQIGTLEKELCLYNHLADDFKEICIFSSGDASELVFQKYTKKNVRVVFRPKLIPRVIYKYLIPVFHYRLIRGLNIVKTNQLPGTFSALLVKIFNPRAKFYIRMGYWYSYTQRKKGRILGYLFSSFCEAIFFHLADGIIVTAEYVRQGIRKKYSLPEEKISLIPNSINLGRYRPLDNIKKSKNRFVYVGRISEEKNLLNAAQALASCGFGLDVVGQGDEKNIKTICEQTKIDLKFLGRVSNEDMPLLLNKYHFFILPSFYEGCPKSLLEAMACGLICVGANVDGINEIIKDGENGYLCGVTAMEIEACLKRLQKIGENGQVRGMARITVEQKYGLDFNYQKEMALYQL